MADADNTAEIWKTIPFAPDYEASTHGQVRRAVAAKSRKARFPVGHILKPSRCGRFMNYLSVALTIDGRARRMNLHRVVARTFLGEPPAPSYEVAHKDGDGANCRLDNLSWKTHISNEADKIVHGTHTRGLRNGVVKITEADAIAIRAMEGVSQAAIGKMFGISQTQVGRIRRGVRWGWL